MPVSPRIAQERQTRHDARIAAAKQVIPHGSHCYTITGVTRREDGMPVVHTDRCPYWKGRTDWSKRGFGYCRLLKAGDSTQGRTRDGAPLSTMLLWDGVKECGLNDDDPDQDVPATSETA
jgi:hypothetical protein